MSSQGWCSDEALTLMIGIDILSYNLLNIYTANYVLLISAWYFQDPDQLGQDCTTMT